MHPHDLLAWVGEQYSIKREAFDKLIWCYIGLNRGSRSKAVPIVCLVMPKVHTYRCMVYNLGPFCLLASLSWSLSKRLKILPLGLLGMTSTNWTPSID